MSLSRREILAAGSLLLTQAGWLRAADDDADTSNEFETNFSEFTTESLESIEEALEWTKGTFNRDGGCGQDIGQPSDTACSAAVGLALLSQGSTPVEGPYSEELRGITSYLLRVANAGLIPKDKSTYIRGDLSAYADYFFVALYLTQVMGEGSDDPAEIRDTLEILVNEINEGQSPQGHWGTDAIAPEIGATVGWACLRGAHFAGFRVEANIERTRDWIISRMGAGGGGSRGLYRNSAGVRVLYPMGAADTDQFRNALAKIFEFVNDRGTSFGRLGGEEFLSFHLINETMLQMGGENWEKWFVPARQKFLECQNADGSWTGHTCINSRTFCTAMALLVLCSPNRYLPVSQS